MSRLFFRVACLAFLASGLLPRFAQGKSEPPSDIDFGRMVEDSEVIAVAHFVGQWDPAQKDHHVDLDLTRIVKGSLKPGKYQVGYEHIPWVRKDHTEFVAFLGFLGTERCWRYAGVPISKENRINEGVVYFGGFDQKHCCIVTPNLATLDQINGFIKNRTLTYTIQGPLYFPRQGQPNWEPSELHVEVFYDALTGKAKVQGLPKLRGFPACPEVFINSFFGFVRVTYSDDREAPLELQGRMQSVEPKTGVMQAKFVVVRPDVLSRQAFEEYASDPYKGRSFYTVKLACRPFGVEKARCVTITRREELGELDLLEGWTEESLLPATFCRWTRDGRATIRLASGEKLTFEFDSGDVEGGPDVFGWLSQDDLLYRLLKGDISGHILLTTADGERELTTFTATLGEVSYAQLDSSRGERFGLSADDDESRPSKLTAASAGVGWPPPLCWGAVALAVSLLGLVANYIRRLTLKNRSCPP